MPPGTMETVVAAGDRFEQWLRASRALLAARQVCASWPPRVTSRGLGAVGADSFLDEDVEIDGAAGSTRGLETAVARNLTDGALEAPKERSLETTLDEGTLLRCGKRAHLKKTARAGSAPTAADN